MTSKATRGGKEDERCASIVNTELNIYGIRYGITGITGITDHQSNGITGHQLKGYGCRESSDLFVLI